MSNKTRKIKRLKRKIRRLERQDTCIGPFFLLILCLAAITVVPFMSGDKNFSCSTYTPLQTQEVTHSE